MLQGYPFGMPLLGGELQDLDVESHDWLTHCWSGNGIGESTMPFAHAAPVPPHMPSVPQKKNAWQSLSCWHESPR